MLCYGVNKIFDKWGDLVDAYLFRELIVSCALRDSVLAAAKVGPAGKVSSNVT